MKLKAKEGCRHEMGLTEFCSRSSEKWKVRKARAFSFHFHFRLLELCPKLRLHPPKKILKPGMGGLRI
jgi:hypothetical protein